MSLALVLLADALSQEGGGAERAGIGERIQITASSAGIADSQVSVSFEAQGGGQDWTVGDVVEFSLAVVNQSESDFAMQSLARDCGCSQKSGSLSTQVVGAGKTWKSRVQLPLRGERSALEVSVVGGLAGEPNPAGRSWAFIATVEATQKYSNWSWGLVERGRGAPLVAVDFVYVGATPSQSDLPVLSGFERADVCLEDGAGTVMYELPYWRDAVWDKIEFPDLRVESPAGVSLAMLESRGRNERVLDLAFSRIPGLGGMCSFEIVGGDDVGELMDVAVWSQYSARVVAVQGTDAGIIGELYLPEMQPHQRAHISSPLLFERWNGADGGSRVRCTGTRLR